ncbi:MAG: type II toxin-antitoxin system HicB family antitoxin [Singulisphaera sp.]
MKSSQSIASILLEILARGILSIRASAGDPGRCVIEADHIHNLPNLIRDYSPQLLSFYWEVERASFISQTPEDLLAGFEPLWRDLSPHVTSVDRTAMEYVVVIERGADGGYSAYVPDLPGCVSCGDSIEEAKSLIREAISLHVDSLQHHHEPIPGPSAVACQVPVSARVQL